MCSQTAQSKNIVIVALGGTSLPNHQLQAVVGPFLCVSPIAARSLFG